MCEPLEDRVGFELENEEIQNRHLIIELDVKLPLNYTCTDNSYLY